jgi:sterol desaturase/sphingolipid hydroxylase (fatty acid hydroxylase superfamily)
MSPKTALSIVLLAYVALALAAERKTPRHAAREWALNVLGFAGLSFFSYVVRDQLLARFGLSVDWTAGARFAAPRVVLALILADATLYGVHRLMHTSLLWRGHRWHHSPARLTWLSGTRSSFLHVAMHVVPQVLIVTALGLTGWELFAYYATTTFFQFWIHLEASPRLPRWVGRVFVTPAYHRVHHAKAGFHGKNFANMLVFWDHLFGTQVKPEAAPTSFALGVDDEAGVARSVIGL